VLVQPSNAEIARVLGASTAPAPDLHDLAVLGAGPAGLAAAVYGASEGLRTVVIEWEALGGQAGSSSRSRNYLGFPRGISGRELTSRAYDQAWLFGATFIFVHRRHWAGGARARARAAPVQWERAAQPRRDPGHGRHLPTPGGARPRA
jgi:thioredoxin reductase (NADPH)